MSAIFALELCSFREKNIFLKIFIFFYKFFNFFFFFRPRSRFGESHRSRPRPSQMAYNIIRIGSNVFFIYLVEFGGGFDGRTWDKLPPKVPWAVNIPVLNPTKWAWRGYIWKKNAFFFLLIAILTELGLCSIKEGLSEWAADVITFPSLRKAVETRFLVILFWIILSIRIFWLINFHQRLKPLRL